METSAPESSSSKRRRYPIAKSSTDSLSHFLLTSLPVQAKQSDGFVVTQFHYTEWPENGWPYSTGSLVEMLKMIQSPN